MNTDNASQNVKYMMWYKNKLLIIEKPFENWISLGKTLVNNGTLKDAPSYNLEDLIGKTPIDNEDIWIFENSNIFDTCIKCGGTMIGDGYTMVRHCEFSDPPDDLEPDAKPVYCDFKEE